MQFSSHVDNPKGSNITCLSAIKVTTKQGVLLEDPRRSSLKRGGQCTEGIRNQCTVLAMQYIKVQLTSYLLILVLFLFHVYGWFFLHLYIYKHTHIHIYICIPHVPGAHEDHRELSESFELELHKTVSHSLSVRNQTQILRRAARIINQWTISPASFFFLLLINFLGDTPIRCES